MEQFYLVWRPNWYLILGGHPYMEQFYLVWRPNLHKEEVSKQCVSFKEAIVVLSISFGEI